MNDYQLSIKTIATVECGSSECNHGEDGNPLTISVQVFTDSYVPMWQQATTHLITKQGWEETSEDWDNALYCPECIKQHKIDLLKSEIAKLQTS